MRIPDFTPAERSVIRLISLGLSTREVAHVLGKAESTVDNQRTSAMRSAEITTATELVRVVLLAGVSTLQDDLTPAERRKVKEIRRQASQPTKRPRAKSMSGRTAPQKKRSAKKKRVPPKRVPNKSAAVGRKKAPRKPAKNTAIKKRPGPTRKFSAPKRSGRKKAITPHARTRRHPVKEAHSVQPAPKLAMPELSSASPELPVTPVAEPGPEPTSS